MNLASISLGQTATGTTCTISSTNANDWFKITTNSNGKLIVEMTPSAADLDLEVYKGPNCGSLASVGTSNLGGASKETVTTNANAGDIFWIKPYYYSNSATGSITAKLVECAANNAVDTACPAAKPYCTNNVCVECFVDTDCKGTDGTYNTYCPKDSDAANYILPSCTAANECRCAAECTANTECAPNFCCNKEGPQGPGISPGTCKSKGDIQNPWLCT